MTITSSARQRLPRRRLKHLARIDISNVDKHSVDGETPVMLCNYVDVYKNEVITRDLPFMKATATPEQIRKFSLLPNDVIITKDSETPDDIGVPALVKDEVPDLVCGYHLAVMRPQAGVLYGPYLLRVLQSADARQYYSMCANGVTRFGLTQYGIKNLSVEIPSFSLQKDIANFLDRETAKADALVAKYERLIELLEEKQVALITNAVTKGLNANATMKESGVDWLGAVPRAWQVMPLKYLASMKSGDNITAHDIEEAGDYAVYGGNGLRGYTDRFTHSGNFVLIGRQGALCGNVNYAHGNFWASEHAVVVTPRVEAPLRWLGELLRSMNLGQYSATAAQPGLSVEAIKNLRVPVPPVEERRQVAAYLDSEIPKIDRLSEAVRQAISTVREHRAALITAAVTGHIDVRAYKTKDLEEVVA